MNKPTILLHLILTLILTACSGSISNATSPASGDPGRGAAGELSAPIQIALGTIKLDGTEKAVTVEQAKELLPLWETLQQLEGSDTAATQEKEALISQIQETMTSEQTQAITALGLSRQEMFSIMQSQALGVGGTPNGTTQSGGTSTNRGSFGPGGGDFMGPPPDGDGGFPGGNPNMQGQRSQSSDSTDGSSQQAATDPNRIPTPLIQAVIEYLKTKAGA